HEKLRTDRGIAGEPATDLLRHPISLFPCLTWITIVVLAVGKIPSAAAGHPVEDNSARLIQEIRRLQPIDDFLQLNPDILRHVLAVEAEGGAESDPSFDPWPLLEKGRRDAIERITAGGITPKLAHLFCNERTCIRI